MWFLIILIILLALYIYSIDRRTYNAKNSSFRITVNILQALLSYKKFGEMTGIKSAAEGKGFKDWSKNDIDKWHKKFSKIIANNCVVQLTFLPSENAYFTKSSENPSNIVLRDDYTNINIYNRVIFGDETEMKENISFTIYERKIKKKNGKYGWVLIPCIRYGGEMLIDRSKFEFIPLCEFPLFEGFNTEKIEEQGFEVEVNEDRLIKDVFGEEHLSPELIICRKNGAEIFITK